MRQTCQAIVLHSRPFQDSGLLIDLFSQDFGRIVLISKQARKNNKSPLKALLQIGAVLEVTFSGNGEVKKLWQADMVRAPVFYQGETFACASYISELMMRTLQSWQPFPELFDCLYQNYSLIQHNDNRLLSLRQIEFELVRSLGIAVDLQYDRYGEPIQTHEYYHLIVDEGFEKSNVKMNKGFSGNDIMAIACNDFSSSKTLKTWQQINQQLLKPLIGAAPLKSRELLKQWRQQRQ